MIATATSVTNLGRQLTLAAGPWARLMTRWACCVCLLATASAEANEVFWNQQTLPHADPTTPTKTIHGAADRIWVINTRWAPAEVDQVDLSLDPLRVSRVDFAGREVRSSLKTLMESITRSRRVVYYVHGNRFAHHEAVFRSLSVHQRTREFGNPEPIDWVIWSWPSEKEGILASDARLKAKRADAQSFYLGRLLRYHAFEQIPTAMVGYSFGCSVITGSLHLAAGGPLAGRSLPGPSTVGLNVKAGLVAPAIEKDWLDKKGRHALAPQNLERLTVMFNRSDVALKQYWLIEKIRSNMALGFTGPKHFADRFDQTSLPVFSYDCTESVGRLHNELNYYQRACQAGQKMACLIDDDPFCR